LSVEGCIDLKSIVRFCNPDDLRCDSESWLKVTRFSTYDGALNFVLNEFAQ